MKILLYIFDCLFGLMGVGLFSGYTASKHIGLLLGGVVFLGAAAASFYLVSWWPLLIGFVLALVLRLLGLDPGARA